MSAPRPTATVSTRRSRRPGLGLWDFVLMHDIALVKLFMGGRVLLTVPAGMAVGYLVAELTGLPAVVGLMLGALPAFLTCFVVVDQKASRVAARSGALIVPFVLALFCSIALREFRVLELVLIVALLFVQFYLPKFGTWAGDFGAGLFAAYLCGLLLPLPLASFPVLALMFAASLAAAVAVRSIFFHPNAYRSLLRSRRAFLAWENRVLNAAADLLEGSGSVKTLERRRRQAHEAALIADGMLAQTGAGPTGSTADDLHRLLFDTELTVDGLARVAEELCAGPTPLAMRRSVATALRRVLAEGGRAGDRAARDLLEAVGDVEPSVEHALHRVALLLFDLASSNDDWVSVRKGLPRDGTGVPFESPVVLVGGRPAGSGPVLNDELALGGMSGPWGRVRVSPALRTAIQAAIAVAIAEPIALLIDGQRFYWAVIGVMVVLAGTNSTHERLRKVANRGLGTVAGGAIGIALVGLLGTGHVWWSLVVVMVGLTVGMYGFTRSYFVWVVGLVVVLCQVYAFSGQFTDGLIVYRLAENLLGALLAVGVSMVVLPVATGAMIRRAMLRQLATVRAFVETSGLGLDGPETSTRLRSASRAVDHATYQLEAVLQPLVRFPSGGGVRRDDETRTLLVGVARTLRDIAYRGERHRPLPAEQAEALGDIAQVLAASIGRLAEAVAGRAAGSWTSAVPLIGRLDETLAAGDSAALDAATVSPATDPAAAESSLLGYRLHALARVDDALAQVAALHGLASDSDTTALVDRRATLSAGRVRSRFPAA